MADPSTYWHTIRYLRPGQMLARLEFRLSRPRPDLRPYPPLRPMTGIDWRTPAKRRRSLVGPECLSFLNESHDLATHGWDDPALEKLWRYNLHYFEDLNSEGGAERTGWHRELIGRWIRENPPGLGTGWEPYPTSLRVTNWIKWALSGNPLPPQWIHSLAIQARWLSRRLETHLLGNHLFVNAKALVFAGLFFDGLEAATWLKTGLRILNRELPEQVLTDGGQFERSPMYHALALEDLLDLVNVSRVFCSSASAELPPALVRWDEAVRPMRRWLGAMCHPDGELAFFNDTAMGVAPSPVELERYASSLELGPCPAPPPGLLHLDPSGYVRHQGPEAVALLDVAPIGPDYLPGHAHADTLSFELSVRGQRLFVNSGTSCYVNSAERLRQRGTAAHNTVVVNGQDSSEVWGSFRVARRARPVNLLVRNGPNPTVGCAHDGYRRLPGKPLHQRQWFFGDRVLTIVDRVTGQFERAQARFHLHPSVAIRAVDRVPDGGTNVVVHAPGVGEVVILIEGGLVMNLASTWHPEFGISVPNRVLAADFDGTELRTRVTWRRAS